MPTAEWPRSLDDHVREALGDLSYTILRQAREIEQLRRENEQLRQDNEGLTRQLAEMMAQRDARPDAPLISVPLTPEPAPTG